MSGHQPGGGLPDDVRDGLDRQQLAETIRLVTEYGHSYPVAAGLAAIGRALAEEHLATPLILVTGV